MWLDNGSLASAVSFFRLHCVACSCRYSQPVLKLFTYQLTEMRTIRNLGNDVHIHKFKRALQILQSLGFCLFGFCFLFFSSQNWVAVQGKKKKQLKITLDD